MARNIYIVNKNRRPGQGGGPPGDFGKSLSGGITPGGVLTTQVFAPPPPQNFTKFLAGGIAPSGVLTRTLIQPPPPGQFNEPAGMTRIIEDTYEGDPTILSERSPTGRKTGMLDGWRGVFNWDQNSVSQRLLRRVTGSPTGPMSAPYAWRYEIPSFGGNTVNTLAPSYDYWDDGFSSTNRLPYREMYMRCWFATERTYSDGLYESHGQGIKMFYLAHGNTTANNGDFFMLASPTGPFGVTTFETRHEIMPYLKYYNLDSDGGGINAGSVGQGNFRVGGQYTVAIGQYRLIEIYAKLNSLTSNSEDGLFYMWVDGVLRFRRDPAFGTGWRGRSLTNRLGYYRVHVAPVNGGAPTVRTRSEFWRYDHLYVSVRGLNQ